MFIAFNPFSTVKDESKQMAAFVSTKIYKLQGHKDLPLQSYSSIYQPPTAHLISIVAQ